MFARAFTLLPLALLASASTLKARDDGWGNQCSTGSVNCCNSLQSVDEAHSWLAKRDLLDVVAGVTGLLGVGCSPIDVLAISGNSCSGQTACCSDNEYNGFVNLACDPINLNL